MPCFRILFFFSSSCYVSLPRVTSPVQQSSTPFQQARVILAARFYVLVSFVFCLISGHILFYFSFFSLKTAPHSEYHLVCQWCARYVEHLLVLSVLALSGRPGSHEEHGGALGEKNKSSTPTCITVGFFRGGSIRNKPLPFFNVGARLSVRVTPR